MKTLAAGRFVAATAVGGQRWAGAALLFALALGVTFVSGGDALMTFAQGAAWLFPTSAWLVVATLHSEDTGQAAVTDVALGGPTQARLVRLAVAGAAALLASAVSVLAATAFVGGKVTSDQLALGAVAHLVCVIGGGTAGLLCARPLIRRPGWALAALLIVVVAEIAVPNVPPVRAAVDVLGRTDAGDRWPALALIAVETLGGCLLLGAAGLLLGRRAS